MPITLNGTSGIVNNATDLNYTGTLTGGTGVVNFGSQFYKSAAGAVGINTISPAADLNIVTTGDAIFADRFSGSAVGAATIALRKARGSSASPTAAQDNDNVAVLSFRGYDGSAYQISSTIVAEVDAAVSSGQVPGRLVFSTASAAGVVTEAARIDRLGNFMVNTTANDANVGTNPTKDQFCFNAGAGLRISITTSNIINRSGDGNVFNFRRNGTGVGSISVTASATAYNTSSDYRLKDVTGPLTGSGEFIDALQPKVGTWKVDGSKFVGFVAHEVQAVSPSSVVGTKDEVDAEGNPVMQAVAYGSAELIANMVAELQALRKRVAELEAK